MSSSGTVTLEEIAGKLPMLELACSGARPSYISVMAANRLSGRCPGRRPKGIRMSHEKMAAIELAKLIAGLRSGPPMTDQDVFKLYRECLAVIREQEAVPLDQPSGVVGLAKLEQGLTQFLDGLEGLHPQQVFLERADEPLGTAGAFRRPDEGGRTGDAEEGDLLLEVVGHVLRSMVMPHGQTVGDRPGEQ